MSQGAPDAIQVADRFHLLHNLEETLETAFKGHNTVLKQVEKDHLQADGLVVLPSVDLPEDSQSPKALNRARRLETV
jgi:transposase